MGAECRVWVKAIVSTPIVQWIEVSAVTLGEARDMVSEMPHVETTLDATYEDPTADPTTEGREP